MREEQPELPERIGLIADTHGDAQLLYLGIQALLHKGADCIVHLGDFCDTQMFESLGQVFSLLRHYRVRTVKGNNDFQIEKMLKNGDLPQFRTERNHWLTYLHQTPALLRLGGICCCHSLPYASVRAYYDPVDTGGTEKAAEVFHRVSDHVIFCGHSHAPVMFRSRNGVITREPIRAKTTRLLCGQRYIIIVGAGENAECAVFDTNRLRYERIRIPEPGRVEQEDERAEFRL